MNETIFVVIDSDEFRSYTNYSLLSMYFFGVDIYCFTDPIDAIDFIEQLYEKNRQRIIILTEIVLKHMSGEQILEWFTGFSGEKHERIEMHVVTALSENDKKNYTLQYPKIKSVGNSPVTNEWLACTFPEYFI